MNRYRLARTFRFFFHLHYSVQVEGMEHVLDGKVHLLMPNHTAYTDPLVIGSECWRIPLRPMCDAWIFRNPVFAFFLRQVDAIVVPDAVESRKNPQAMETLRQLSTIALDHLRAGHDLLFYPSGHVKLKDREEIGSRRLAYEVCRDLPDGVEVLLVRMRGLEGSYFSHLKTKPCLRRKVTILFQPMTDQLRHWAQTLDKRAFNEKLEEWYNQD